MTRILLQRCALFIVILAIYSGLRSHTFLSSFPHDEGIFLYGGQAWAHGETLYRDFWDHKPPATFFFHSIPLRLFPFSTFAVKWHECFWLSLSAMLLFFLCRRKFSPWASVLTLILYIFYTSMPSTIRTGGLTEESALFFLVLSFFLILRKEGSFFRNAFYAGLALGAAIQFRQTYFLSILFLLGTAWHTNSPVKTLRLFVKSILTIVIGTILPELLVSLYFQLHGAWYDYFEASYIFNLIYVGPSHTIRTPLSILTLHWKQLLATGPYLIAPILALCTAAHVPNSIRWMIIPSILAFLGDAFSISLSGEYYEHYYVQAAVSIHLLLALFIEGLINGIRCIWKKGTTGIGTRNWSVFAGYILLILLSSGLLSSGIVTYLSDYHSTLQERREPESSFAFQNSAASAVQGMTQPEDRILLIGRDPNSIYIQARRYAGSRYFHYSPLWKDKLLNARTLVHEETFFSDLDNQRPVLILVDRRIGERFEEDWPFVQKVNQYLEQNYKPLEQIVDRSPEETWFWYGSRLTIWVRNDREQDIGERYPAFLSKTQ